MGVTVEEPSLVSRGRAGMSNKFGQAYGLTTISPIIKGRTDGVHHAQELRATSRRSRSDSGVRSRASPGRIQPAGLSSTTSSPRPIPAARIISSRSTWCSSPISTDRSSSIVSSLVAAIPDVIDSVWSHCVGYPGSSKPLAVLDYIRDCQVDTTLYFGGYPGATVEAALRALLVQRSMIEFIEESRHLPSGELQAAFRSFRARMEKAPTPAPASM